MNGYNGYTGQEPPPPPPPPVVGRDLGRESYLGHTNDGYIQCPANKATSLGYGEWVDGHPIASDDHTASSYVDPFLPCLSSTSSSEEDFAGVDTARAHYTEDGVDREAPNSAPACIIARLIYFGSLYILCFIVYICGITWNSTEITRMPGTPLEHTDYRCALRFIQDTKDQGWWFAFGVLFTTTIAFPFIKFTASLFVLHSVARPERRQGPWSRLAHNIMHVVASYQMADVFVGCLLSAFLNVSLTTTKIGPGFYMIALYVIMSIMFQHSSELVRMRGHCYARVTPTIDRLNVIILSVFFLVCYWVAVSYDMIEIRFSEEEMVFEKSSMTLLESVRALDAHMPRYVTVLYVYFLILAPNLYVVSLAIVACIGRRPRKDELQRRQANGLYDADVDVDDDGCTVVDCLEALLFWIRPWAMYDEFVLVLWVVLLTLRIPNLSAVEATTLIPATVLFPAFSSLKLMSLSGVALTVLRWFWFQARCVPRQLSYLKSVGVLMVCIVIFLIPTPQKPQTANDVFFLNHWLDHIRMLVNDHFMHPESQDTLAAMGNCSALPAASAGLVGRLVGKCQGDGPLYTYTDDGSNLAIEWVTGLSTAAIVNVVVTRQVSSYLVTADVEMQFLLASLQGTMCKGGFGCGDIGSVLTWGKRFCATDVEDPQDNFCSCPPEGHTWYGAPENSRWAPPLQGSVLCSGTTVFRVEDLRPGAWKRCYCADPTVTQDTDPRRLKLQVLAACSAPDCGGHDPIANLTVQLVDFNPLKIDVPVSMNVMGAQVVVRKNWTDASGLLENVVREKITPYLSGNATLPYFKIRLVEVINQLMRLNTKE